MPDLSAEESRRRFLGARVARLATVTPAGGPHLVVLTFAAAGPDTLVTAVDHKPKRTLALARLANIAVNPDVSLLADHYDEDWSQLWWARADGHASVLDAERQADEHGAALVPLMERYDQYAGRPPRGPVIVVTVTRWSGWRA